MTPPRTPGPWWRASPSAGTPSGSVCSGRSCLQVGRCSIESGVLRNYLLIFDHIIRERSITFISHYCHSGRVRRVVLPRFGGGLRQSREQLAGGDDDYYDNYDDNDDNDDNDDHYIKVASLNTGRGGACVVVVQK